MNRKWVRILAIVIGVAVVAATGFTAYFAFFAERGGDGNAALEEQMDSPSGDALGTGPPSENSPAGSSDAPLMGTSGDGFGGTPPVAPPPPDTSADSQSAAPTNPPGDTPTETPPDGTGDTTQPTTSALPLSGAVIGIDAGHQKKGNYEQEQVAPGSSEKKAKVSSGTQGVSSRVPEYVVNLDVALLLKGYLEELGAEVVMVRETHDVNISNIERATMMNDRNVDLCIRIHCNGNNNNTIRGALMLVPKSSVYDGIQERSYDAGVIIHRNFLSSTGAHDGGVKYRSDLTGFNWSEVPVCLIEMGYMSNPEDDLLLVDPDYQVLCARGLADGVVEWWAGLV